jgi:hypothetical protein
LGRIRLDARVRLKYLLVFFVEDLCSIMPRPPYPDPIFVLGITERSGTNFLFHLLCLHSRCEHGGPIWENELIRHLDHLARYTGAVYTSWNPIWQVDSTIGPEGVLRGDLGDALIRYLNRQMPSDAPTEDEGSLHHARRLVTKLPSVRGLPLFFDFFPRAQLIVLVRDGRAVVESGMRTFDWDFEAASRRWAAGARTVLEFLGSSTDHATQYLLVRYEDLVEETEHTLRHILEFLELPAADFDFHAATCLPVVGSSDVRAAGTQSMHWDPVVRQGDFNPTSRWHDWPPARQDRFLWLAARYLTQLGYPAERRCRSGAWWRIRNSFLDLAWYVRRPLLAMRNRRS